MFPLRLLRACLCARRYQALSPGLMIGFPGCWFPNSAAFFAFWPNFEGRVCVCVAVVGWVGGRWGGPRLISDFKNANRCISTSSILRRFRTPHPEICLDFHIFSTSGLMSGRREGPLLRRNRPIRKPGTRLRGDLTKRKTIPDAPTQYQAIQFKTSQPN